MSNTIRLKNYLNIVNNYVAAAGITPGHLIELTSSGTVQAHSSALGFKGAMFACEDELQGKTISDAYVATDIVQCVSATPGDEIYGLLSDGENVAIGDALESNGDGTFQKFTSGVIIAIALDAVDMSGSAGEDPSGRIAVRIV